MLELESFLTRRIQKQSDIFVALKFNLSFHNELYNPPGLRKCFIRSRHPYRIDETYEKGVEKENSSIDMAYVMAAYGGGRILWLPTLMRLFREFRRYDSSRVLQFSHTLSIRGHLHR